MSSCGLKILLRLVNSPSAGVETVFAIQDLANILDLALLKSLSQGGFQCKEDTKYIRYLIQRFMTTYYLTEAPDDRLIKMWFSSLHSRENNSYHWGGHAISL